jgi:hypothetical protein
MTKHIIKYFRFINVCIVLWIITVSLASSSSLANTQHYHPTEYEKNWANNLFQDIKEDFNHYMSDENLLFLGDTFLISGVLANTGLDRSFADHWQTDIQNSSMDNLFEFPKHIGGLSYYYAPIYLATMSIGHLREHTLLGNVIYHWGYRSLRTFIIGGLQQVFLTNLLGSGRPNRNEDSKWQSFKYQTGVSGHAFYGAIPFLTAAMMTDPPLFKYGLYFLSTLPGISRINSNRHYLSQVIMGWTLAFLSARSVYYTDLARTPPFQVGIYPKADGAMLAAHLQF